MNNPFTWIQWIDATGCENIAVMNLFHVIIEKAPPNENKLNMYMLNKKQLNR